MKEYPEESAVSLLAPHIWSTGLTYTCSQKWSFDFRQNPLKIPPVTVAVTDNYVL